MGEHSSGEAYHKLRAAPASTPSGCPIDQHFTPFDPDYLRDPYPILEQLRGKRPVCYAPQLGYLVVTRMEDVLAVFRNPDVFSSENVQDPVFPICERAAHVLAAEDFDPVAVMSNRQQPDHTRIRKYTREGFSGRRMKLLEPYIRRRSHELLDAMLDAGGPLDFISAFGHPLPGQVIFRFIGFPEADDQQLMDWTANRLIFTWGQPDEAQQSQIAENMLRYWRYCRDFVAMRRREPADDLTSELLAAHASNPTDLSYREVESVIYGLSFAGHEIVSNYLSNALLSLLPNREEWQALCADASGIPNAMEEVLRYDSPQTSWRRVARVDTTIAGAHVPAGTPIFLSLGAANHEPGEFEDPQIFDPRRENARKHVSFGYGIHFCLGAKLARLEGQIAIETLSQRLPSLHLVPGQSLHYGPNITFRGPQELMVDWSLESSE